MNWGKDKVGTPEGFQHDDVIKWKHFPRNWPFVRGIQSPVPVNSPHKGQWRGALMFSLICVWINGWVNNREAGDLRRHRGHYDVNVMNIKKAFVFLGFIITIMRPCYISYGNSYTGKMTYSYWNPTPTPYLIVVKRNGLVTICTLAHGRVYINDIGNKFDQVGSEMWLRFM